MCLCLPPRSTLEQAFTDLSNLMGKAAEMVQLAERFRVHINRKDTGGLVGGRGVGGWVGGWALQFSHTHGQIL